MRMIRLLAPLAALCLLAAAPPAQAWPDRPIRVMVGYAAGGATDVIGRILIKPLAAQLGQPLVIENRTGADGNIAAEATARAAADGHTLFLTGASHAVNPALYRDMRFDADADFEMISAIGDAPNMLAVHPGVPAKSLAELVALAKTKPGQLNYASTASIIHLATELLLLHTGIKVERVAYKGAAPGTAAILSGETQMVLSHAAGLVPHVTSGALRGLAVTTAGRTAIYPALPTVAEAGFPGYVFTTWYGMMAPRGVPADVLARLNQAMVTVLADPQVKEQLFAQGIEARSSSPEALRALLREDIARWRDVVARTGITLD